MLSLGRRSGIIGATHGKRGLSKGLVVGNHCRGLSCFFDRNPETSRGVPPRHQRPSCTGKCFFSSSTKNASPEVSISSRNSSNNNKITKIKSFAPKNHHQGQQPTQKRNQQPTSSSTSTAVIGPSIPRRYVEVTKNLVYNKQASSSPWSKEDWKSAESTLKGWTQQSHVSSTSVQLCWDLLERMVLEAESESHPEGQRHKTKARNSIPKLTTRHLNLALDHWRIANRYRINNTTGTKNEGLDPRQWSASQVLLRIDNYVSRVPSLCPDNKTWTMLMAVQTKQNPVLAPAFCRDLLQRITSPSSSSSSTATKSNIISRPNAKLLTQVMDAYVKSGDLEAPMANQSIFDYMVEQSAPSTTAGGYYNREMAPTEHSLTRLLQSWVLGGTTRRCHGDPKKEDAYKELALEKMGHSLQYMLQTAQNIPGTLRNSFFLNLILSACIDATKQVPKSSSSLSSSQEPSISYATMVPLVDAVMTWIYDESGINHPKLAPNGKAYADMIVLWSKSKLPDGPEKAEQWLKRMKQASSEEDHVSAPRASLYTNVISAWESSGRPDAPYHGEVLWNEMISQRSEYRNSFEDGYHLLLSLWSKSTLPEAPEKASKLLKGPIVEWSPQRENSTIVPSCRDFVTVISSWAKKSRNDKEAPYKAQELLELLVKKYKAKRLTGIMNDAPFNATIHAWANSGLPEAWTKVEELIQLMKQESQYNPSVAPSIVTVWSALQSLEAVDDNNKGSKDVVGFNAAPKATALLEYINNESSNTNRTLRGQIYDCVLHLWSESGHPDAPLEAQSILENRVLLEPKQYRRFDSSMACFLHVLDCWRKNGDSPEASEQMTRLLNIMRQETDLMYNTGSSSSFSKRPGSYVHVLRGWANSGLPQATEEATIVLELMLEESKTVPAYDPKIENWFRILIDGLAQNGQQEKAEHVFRHVMPTLVTKTGWGNYSPTTAMYGELVESWSKSNDPGAADRAFELLDEMIDLYEAGSEIVKPSAIHFAPVMTRYAQQGDIDMVEQLCDRLQELRYSSRDDQDGVDFLPNGEILCALSSAGGDRAAREAAVLHLVLERARLTNGVGKSNGLPNNAAFDSVLDSLSKSGLPSAGQLAETILLKLQELHDHGCHLDKPNFATFQKVLDCWAESEMEGAARRAEEILQLAEELYEAGDNNELKPTFEGYMSVVDALSHSYDSDAPERILKHMRKMQQLSKAGDSHFQLDGRPYAALAKAYSRSGRNDAALLAQTVVDETPEHFRCTDLYNALIRAQGGDSNRAEGILDEMQKEFLQGNELMRPDTESFNNVILSWSKSGSPMAAWRADGIFQRMTELSVSGHLDVRPNGTTFDLVIATLANDWGSDSAAKCDRYLELLKDLYESGETDCTPSVTSYTEAIRAWGDNTEDPRAVLRAKALLDEMHELAKNGIVSAKPDQHTYAVFLKALALSSVSDKAQLAEDVVHSMKENNVEPDQAVLSHLYRSMSGGFPAATSTVSPDEEESAEFPSALSPRRENSNVSSLIEDE